MMLDSFTVEEWAMLRFLGVVTALLLGIAGLGYYLGWFSVSTSNDGQSTHINVTVDKEKVQADEEAAKKKLEEAEKKIKEQVKPVTDKDAK